MSKQFKQYDKVLVNYNGYNHYSYFHYRLGIVLQFHRSIEQIRYYLVAVGNSKAHVKLVIVPSNEMILLSKAKHVRDDLNGLYDNWIQEKESQLKDISKRETDVQEFLYKLKRDTKYHMKLISDSHFDDMVLMKNLKELSSLYHKLENYPVGKDFITSCMNNIKLLEEISELEMQKSGALELISDDNIRDFYSKYNKNSIESAAYKKYGEDWRNQEWENIFSL